MGLLSRLEQVIEILGEGLAEEERERAPAQPVRIVVEDGSDQGPEGARAEEPEEAPAEEPKEVPEEAAVELEGVPEGMMLVPLSAWEQVLLQLGNLHEAGRDLAESRERAARAEERYGFEQERRKERDREIGALREELEALRSFPPPAPPRRAPDAVPVEVTPTAQIREGFRRLFVRRY